MNCCITGHRDIPEQHLPAVREALRREIARAIDEGCTGFLSGFARGVDLWFAELVAECKRAHPQVRLEAAIPYAGRLRTPDPLFQRLLVACDTVTVHSQEYDRACFWARDRAMVDASDLVLAVYDGRRGGGTHYTLRYAQAQQRRVRIITPGADASAPAVEQAQWTL